MRKRIVLATIALIIQIIQLVKNRTKRISKETLLSITRQLSALSPTALIKNFDKLEDYGICFGRAFASQKCTAILKPKQNIIISKLYELKKFPFRGEIQNFRQLVRIKRPTFFTLNDQFSSVPILETQNLPTMTTHSLERYSSVDKASELNILIYLINLIKNIRIPYVSKTTFCEHFLPQGAQVSILGKYKREASGQICCEKPIMMAKSKNHLIQKLQQKVSQLNFEKYALIFGIAFCLGFACKEVYKFYQNERVRKTDPFQNYDKLYVKSRVCFGCHEKLSNFILEGCGHLSMCTECKEKLKVCGECSKKGDEGLQIYAC